MYRAWGSSSNLDTEYWTHGHKNYFFNLSIFDTCTCKLNVNIYKSKMIKMIHIFCWKVYIKLFILYNFLKVKESVHLSITNVYRCHYMYRFLVGKSLLHVFLTAKPQNIAECCMLLIDTLSNFYYTCACLLANQISVF